MSAAAAGAFGGYWVWANQARVMFDGDRSLIIVNPGVTELQVKEHLYSDWKEWIQLYDYMKYEAAMRAVGGDPTVAGRSLGSTYFLINGWKIRTWEGDHRLIVEGNLYSDDGLDAFVPTLQPHNITISQQVSNLVDQVDNTQIAALVWDQLLAEHQLPATTGKSLKDALKILKVLLAN
jgi:hypothetical protein